MANKLLQSLTIDGQTMDVRNLMGSGVLSYTGSVLGNNMWVTPSVTPLVMPETDIAIINIQVAFPSSATGVRGVRLEYQDEGDTGWNNIATWSMNAVTLGQTFANYAIALFLQKNAKLRLSYYQTSGGNMTLSALNNTMTLYAFRRESA